MNIKFYSGFSKRINSTKIPTGNPTLSLDGDLKDATSVEKPVIKIKNRGAISPAPYVYAYIEKFNRYYFVSDWVYDQGFWYVHMTEDYLASWKPFIGFTNAYIDRCASESDGDIIDTRYITKTNFQKSAVSFGTSLDSTGTFVLGIIGGSADTSQTGGAVTYYALTRTECVNLMNYLLSPAFLNDNGFPQTSTLTQQLTQETAKAFVNPFQFIVSCVWFPLQPSLFYSGNSEAITVGYWLIDTTIATGHKVNSVYIPVSSQVALPVHPQSASRGNYLNYAPYTRLSVYIPPYGVIPIDPSCRRLGSNMRYISRVDPITGVGELNVYCTDELPSALIDEHNIPIVATAIAQVGVPVQIAQVGTDFINAISEGVQAVSSIDWMGAMAGAVATQQFGGIGALKGITPETVGHVANAVMSLSPQVRTSGANGARFWTILYPRLMAEFSLLVDEDNEEMGRPLRQKRVINTLSGYVKCFEVTVDYPCFDTEKDAILMYLTSGFFWE